MNYSLKLCQGIVALSLFGLFTISGCSGCKEEVEEVCTKVCINEGYLNTYCNCDCKPGTSGADCGTLVQPSGVKILKMAIRKFPQSKIGQIQGTPTFIPWDTGESPISRPDSYVEIKSGNTILGVSQVNSQTSTFNLATPGFILNFGHPITLLPITSSYTIIMYDADGPEVAEIMGVAALPFTDYIHSYPYPEVISVTGVYANALGPTVLDVYIEWLF